MGEIHFEFTPEDLKALLGWEHGPQLVRRRAVHRWAGTAWLTLMAASLLVGLRAPAFTWALAPALPLLFWWRYPIESRRRAERAAALQLREADRGGWVGPCTLLLGERALVLRTPLGEQVHGWEEIEQVVTGDALVLLLTRAGGVVALPRRAVPDAATFEACRCRVRSAVA